MTRRLTLPIALVSLLAVAVLTPLGADEAVDPSFRVMSFNIRYDNTGDGENSWKHRRDKVTSMVRFHRADVVGIQEALHHQLRNLKQDLAGFTSVGVARDDGKKSGEYSAILLRTARFEVKQSDTFWLSEDPARPGRGWDAACTRIVTWAELKDLRTDRTVFVFNTHFDHRGQQARLESARLLIQSIVRIAGNSRTIVTGDFNCQINSEPMQVLLQDGTLRDSMAVSKFKHHGPTGTFGGFAKPTAPGAKIDHILVTRELQVRQHGVLGDAWDGRYPSDHLPVLAEVE